MEGIKVLHRDGIQRIEEDWGELAWFASSALGNSDDLTVGRCVIKPGRSNPKHSHPNCSEVLVVLQGRIAHTLDWHSPNEQRSVEVGSGDTVTIPRGIAHQARNIGEEEAVLFVAFSSAQRRVVGE